MGRGVVGWHDRVVIESLLRVSGALVPIEEVEDYAGDRRYVEGALVIEVNGRELMARGQWDCVDQLWSLLLDALARALTDSTAVTFMYPDEPVAVTVDATVRGLLELCVGTRSVMFDRAVFTSHLLPAARRFHGALGRLLGEAVVSGLGAQIREVEGALGAQDGGGR